MSKFFQSGQSLVEVTVAATALIFGLVAIISALLLSVRNSSASNLKTLAGQENQEVIEVFRKFQRELGWESFRSILLADGSTTTYCVQDLPETVTEFQNMSVGACSVSSSFTGFVREALVVINSTNEITVTATVSWQDADQDQSTTITHKFFKI